MPRAPEIVVLQLPAVAVRFVQPLPTGQLVMTVDLGAASLTGTLVDSRAGPEAVLRALQPQERLLQISLRGDAWRPTGDGWASAAPQQALEA